MISVIYTVIYYILPNIQIPTYQQLNIESDKYSKYEEIEVRINNIDETQIEVNEINFKTFSQVKEHISKIIQQIEEDKQKYESSYESRTQYITMMEFKLMEKFDSEAQERVDVERRLTSLVDEKFSLLRNELSKESKNRNESVENFTFYLESEVPKIVDQMKTEQMEREDSDNHINKVVNDEFSK